MVIIAYFIWLIFLHTLLQIILYFNFHYTNELFVKSSFIWSVAKGRVSISTLREICALLLTKCTHINLSFNKNEKFFKTKRLRKNGTLPIRRLFYLSKTYKQKMFINRIQSSALG